MTARRTFQVAFYGAAGAGKRTTLRALHASLPAAGKGPLVLIPDAIESGSSETMFFDYRPPPAASVPAA